MLQRKLLLVFAALAVLMLGSSLVSVIAMSRVLTELNPGAVPAERTPAEASDHFRRTAITLAAIHLVLLNLALVILLRAASLVLRPVNHLVEASRAMAREDYTHRVEVRRHDEFDELAIAFNTMAEQMQTNEARKVETLQQLARTLNHELNNAIAIIELQLRLVERSPGYDASSGERLQRIHEALSHMNRIILSLKDVRRVALTDYLEGVQMLDLPRSTQPAQPDTHPDTAVRHP